MTMHRIAHLFDSIEEFTASQEFLTFTLGEEEYGVDMQLVRELRNYGQITETTNGPDCVKGTMNLRGKQIPIMDLRLKLKHVDAICTACTVVIILSLHGRHIGLVADSVSDVISLKPQQIKNTHFAGSKLNGIYTCGLGRVENRLFILVDMHYLLAEAHHERSEEVAA